MGVAMMPRAYSFIHTYTVLLIWLGHALFREHTNEKPLVEYLELNILPK